MKYPIMYDIIPSGSCVATLRDFPEIKIEAFSAYEASFIATERVLSTIEDYVATGKPIPVPSVALPGEVTIEVSHNSKTIRGLGVTTAGFIEYQKYLDVRAEELYEILREVCRDNEYDNEYWVASGNASINLTTVGGEFSLHIYSNDDDADDTFTSIMMPYELLDGSASTVKEWMCDYIKTSKAYDMRRELLSAISFVLYHQDLTSALLKAASSGMEYFDYCRESSKIVDQYINSKLKIDKTDSE